MSWIIRPMCESDIELIYNIELEAHIKPWSKTILQDCILVGYHCFIFEIGSFDKNEIIGYIINRHDANCCHILNFCIAHQFQSKGYGKQFLSAVLNQLSTTQVIHYAVLEVRSNNIIAINLYKKLGFKIIDIKKNYYNNGKSFEDALVLKRELRNRINTL